MNRQPPDRPAGEREFERAADMMRAGAFEIDQRAYNEVARFNRNERSAAAVKKDRQQNAPITTNREKWRRNPGKYDYPGVDTTFGVTPPEDDQQAAQKVHDNRSERARRADERQHGRVTTNLGLWRNNPEQYDYPGVDTPPRHSGRGTDDNSPDSQPSDDYLGANGGQTGGLDLQLEFGGEDSQPDTAAGLAQNTATTDNSEQVGRSSPMFEGVNLSSNDIGLGEIE